MKESITILRCFIGCNVETKLIKVIGIVGNNNNSCCTIVRRAFCFLLVLLKYDLGEFFGGGFFRDLASDLRLSCFFCWSFVLYSMFLQLRNTILNTVVSILPCALPLTKGSNSKAS